MAELLAGLGRRQPQNFVDFADVRPMHRAKRMGTPQVVDGADRRGHPELDMLGIRRPILGMALFAAFFGQRVLDVAQIGAKFHGQARFLADLAYGGMPVRFVRVDLAFRPAPVVVFRAMHDAQFDAVEYVVRRGRAVGLRRVRGGSRVRCAVCCRGLAVRIRGIRDDGAIGGNIGFR